MNVCQSHSYQKPSIALGPVQTHHEEYEALMNMMVQIWDKGNTLFYRQRNKVGSGNDLFKVSKDICGKAIIFYHKIMRIIETNLTVYDKQVIQISPSLTLHSYMLQFYPE